MLKVRIMVKVGEDAVLGKFYCCDLQYESCQCVVIGSDELCSQNFSVPLNIMPQFDNSN